MAVRAVNQQSSWSRAFVLGMTLRGVLFSLVFLSIPLLGRQQEKPAQPLKEDEACLACHGQPEVKSEKGKSIFIRADKHAASLHGVLACTDCHTSIKDFPHPAKIAKVKCETCHGQEVADAAKSIHAVLVPPAPNVTVKSRASSTKACTAKR
jgi:hypothetical protein